MVETVPVVAAVFAVLAGLIHVYIFVMESLTWTSARTRATFGVGSEAEALATRELAYNQGWYNLFLAAGAIGGAVVGLVASGPTQTAGAAIMVFSTACMAAAALVLITRNSAMARAAAVQGVLPLLAVVTALLLG
ncbi:putative membrane protein [Sanguibacter gelidistatuariae]|uniref:Putative membrane protein n=1 Tax=Sanguibacter gelidistatuariae TaxID=1814289 RepID=A0A1G6RTZ9_9MICO|nr:DUF1304 domain-containing protein [Sanguibacter gelidistatuariae]SDD07457.1 putative membrane protein [Sanguibacter gelidistatuariae]